VKATGWVALAAAAFGFTQSAHAAPCTPVPVSTTGTGTSNLSETLNNDMAISLSSPGSTSRSFSPVAVLSVIKDRFKSTGSNGTSETSESSERLLADDVAILGRAARSIAAPGRVNRAQAQ
jgi:hypothetical protein